jgi:hypothetical protein
MKLPVFRSVARLLFIVALTGVGVSGERGFGGISGEKGRREYFEKGFFEKNKNCFWGDIPIHTSAVGPWGPGEPGDFPRRP